MWLVELSLFPLDKGAGVGKYVGRCLDVIDKSGVDYRLNPMGTVLEGEWDEVMGVAKRCFEELKRDCARVELSVKGDWRAGSGRRMTAKMESVEASVGRPLRR